jgi:hypothetical protein
MCGIFRNFAREFINNCNYSIKEMTVGISTPSNAAYPMLVTLLGMVMEVSFSQPENVLSVDNQQLPR